MSSIKLALRNGAHSFLLRRKIFFDALGRGELFER